MEEKMENTQVVNNESPTTNLDSVLARLAEVEAALGLMKKLYEEKELLTMQLKQLVPVGQEVTYGDFVFSVVDNFAEKNTVFRPAAVKRFDLQVDSLMARAIKADKEAEKLAKKAKKG